MCSYIQILVPLQANVPPLALFSAIGTTMHRPMKASRMPRRSFRLGVFDNRETLRRIQRPMRVGTLQGSNYAMMLCLRAASGDVQSPAPTGMSIKIVRGRLTSQEAKWGNMKGVEIKLECLVADGARGCESKRPTEAVKPVDPS